LKRLVCWFGVDGDWGKWGWMKRMVEYDMGDLKGSGRLRPDIVTFSIGTGSGSTAVSTDRESERSNGDG
jgi:hypothetical protein